MTGIKLKTYKSITLIFLLLIVIVGIVLLVNRDSHSNEAFKIDGKVYTKKTITDMVTYALTGQDATDKSMRKLLAKTIFDMYQTQMAADQVKIVPDSQELENAKGQIKLPTPKNKDEKDYINLLAYNNALAQTYNRYANGNDEGYVYVFDYSQKIIPPPAQERPISGYGNKALIAHDRATASQQAQKYYALYKNGKVTSNQLLNIISQSGLDPFNASKHLNSYDGLSQQVYYQDIYNYIVAQSRPILSDIRTGKVETKRNPGPSDYIDGYYYFVDLKTASHVVTDPQAMVANKKGQLKSVYYGI